MSDPEVVFYFEDAVLRSLRDEVSQTPGGQAGWAKKWGISPQYLSEILRGKRHVSGRVATLLGFRKFPAYEWIGDQVAESEAPAEEIEGPWISDALNNHIESEVA